MSLLGAHISVAGGLCRAISRAEALGVEAMQIFTCNPLQWHGRNIPEAEAEAFRRASLESGVKRIVSHSSYLLNLAGDDYTRGKSRQALEGEIDRCFRLGIDLIVLHPGSARGADRGVALERLASSLRGVLRATEGTPVKILLETMSGQGDILGATVEELADVIEMLDWDDRLGVCVDICHLFGAGVDLRFEGAYERLVSSLGRQVGLGRVGCWHMSDNKGKLGSRVDRHAHIGEGEIGIIPFGMLVSDERFADTPTILETPKDGAGDEGNLSLLRKIRGFDRSGG